MSTVFIYNKANTYGLLQDVKLLDSVLKGRHVDPLEPPVLCELAVHFEVPYYGWMAWAKRNVIVVNPEWWEDAWNPYLAHTDALLFKCEADRQTFFSKTEYRPESFVLPWTSPVPISAFSSKTQADGLLWLLGASVNKRAAAEKILPLWKPEWPQLSVYTTTELKVEHGTNVSVHVKDLSESARQELQTSIPGHLIFSQSEALSLVAQEGFAAGAFLLGNALPTFVEAFKGNEYVYLTEATLEPFKSGVRDTFANAESVLEGCIAAFKSADLSACRESQKRGFLQRQISFKEKAGAAFEKILSTVCEAKVLPQFPSADACPHISVITLLHNRRKFVDLCFHNLMITDYPKDKIEWVVIEDSDIVEEQAADKILKFAHTCSPMNVSYIPLDKKNVPIGAMRNRAVLKAQHDIILFMDDDDHYPPPSFSKRVAWLCLHPWKPSAVACTTIACYDLIHGTSAVNTPPWNLPLRQRISEATLVFKKSWWDGHRFPKVSIAEGEGFLEGRESEVVELQPQQMIVAMSHGKNASSRRIPPSTQPSCFWGFPKEFLLFLHKLASVEVEDVST
jgi:hypothetical protein